MDHLTLPGTQHNWHETTLWQHLETMTAPEVDPVRTMLKQAMPEIQAVLAQAGTSPSDFTLHDSNHSFRVAQRMAEIIPPDVLAKLSGYELALLLISAYLHDIGMTPEQQRVKLHHQYLVTGVKDGPTDTEIEAFQEWLDEEGGGVVPPLARGNITPAQLIDNCNKRRRIMACAYVSFVRPKIKSMN